VVLRTARSKRPATEEELCGGAFCLLSWLWYSPCPRGPKSRQPKDYVAHVVGYAHIDLAWLWRWEESIYDISTTPLRISSG